MRLSLKQIDQLVEYYIPNPVIRGPEGGIHTYFWSPHMKNILALRPGLEDACISYRARYKDIWDSVAPTPVLVNTTIGFLTLKRELTYGHKYLLVLPSSGTTQLRKRFYNSLTYGMVIKPHQPNGTTYLTLCVSGSTYNPGWKGSFSLIRRTPRLIHNTRCKYEVE